MKTLHPPDKAGEKLGQFPAQVRKTKKKMQKNPHKRTTSLTIAKSEFSQGCHMDLEFQDAFKQRDGGCSSWGACCSRQFPGTRTRARGEAVIRQGLAASSELTFPGDAKKAQQNQAKLSHAG